MQSKLWQVVQWDMSDGRIIPLADVLLAFPTLYRNDVVNIDPEYLSTVAARLNETSPSDITFFVTQKEYVEVHV